MDQGILHPARTVAFRSWERPFFTFCCLPQGNGVAGHFAFGAAFDLAMNSESFHIPSASLFKNSKLHFPELESFPVNRLHNHLAAVVSGPSGHQMGSALSVINFIGVPAYSDGGHHGRGMGGGHGGEDGGGGMVPPVRAIVIARMNPTTRRIISAI